MRIQPECPHNHESSISLQSHNLLNPLLQHLTSSPTHSNPPTFAMPLSLRLSKNKPQASSSKRAVSTPTLLSRIRSSAFTSSKVSLLATSSPYDSVKARTPPIPVSCAPTTARPAMKRPKPYGALQAQWRASAKRLASPEQRDCLLGAECIGITDPLLGRIGESESSFRRRSTLMRC